MSHKHPCPNCGEEKWCDIPGCILDPEDYSQCDDCWLHADKQRDRQRDGAVKREKVEE